MSNVAVIGSQCSCYVGGYSVITESPNANIVCDQGIIAVEGAIGTCTGIADGHSPIVTITPSQTMHIINGSPILQVGDRTSCGNIITGSAILMIGE